MSSFTRRIQRKVIRSAPDYEPRPQPTKVFADGSYRTLGRRGWTFISAKRLAAQRKMAAMLDHVLPVRMRKPAKLWRKPAPPAPSTVTRQQIRYARRKGWPVPA
ncbi:MULTISPECIES: hypothetical protein [unclassified Sphingopyxis]|uniref:hypothetical protein n=1 Tax=unclassified Sphingopyxis TaxID=2614943 RepID=UPI0028673A85|nr:MULTISPECIES: hypothetical protein [unclassified Sphingopyxis]MDR7061990.1 hypothetical protein [Sphingopyxis sp. BE235]MDR7182449.1 hypothetical protein [Sphingopyxis sp. BE249]